MNRFRLRGTWEEDPAPIPFPRNVAGRSAGVDAPEHHTDIPETQLSERTREMIEHFDEHIDRLQIRFEEFAHLLEDEEEAGSDGPSAA